MSTKMALIIGDYSNGWNDAWVVQVPTRVKTQAELVDQKEFVLQEMSSTLNKFVSKIEGNEKIVPPILDEPCCDQFKDWFETQENSVKFCVHCGTPITKERREKHS